MSTRFIRPVIIFCVALVFVVAGILSWGVFEKISVDMRGFSDTQSWDREVYAHSSLFTPFLGDSAFSLALPPPPKNSSRETTEELAYLHRLAESRTDAQIAEIEQELSVDSAVFGDLSYGELLANRPKTEALLSYVLSEFSAVVVVQKERFDRIRPSQLDKTLDIAIELPDHPAYPSGHAAQSKLIALVLSELDPENTHAYEESALRVAHNREIAGVHYPSDSIAGQMLAGKYFALLTRSENFKLLLEKAADEWVER
jgi:hypothetical protein